MISQLLLQHVHQPQTIACYHVNKVKKLKSMCCKTDVQTFMQSPTAAVKLASIGGRLWKNSQDQTLKYPEHLKVPVLSWECDFFCTCGFGVPLHSFSYRAAVQLEFCSCCSLNCPAGMQLLIHSEGASSSTILQLNLGVQKQLKPMLWLHTSINPAVDRFKHKKYFESDSFKPSFIKFYTHIILLSNLFFFSCICLLSC